MNTLTQSLDPCPRCGRAHHLPLIFVPLETPITKQEITYTHLAQCTWTLNPILARLDEDGRLEIEHSSVALEIDVIHENILD